jgi:hypothetical protein
MRAILILIAFVGVCATLCFAQGGPPLLTDDPGTPGNHNWEINTGFTVDHRTGLTEYETPILDINYGWGERVQLKFEIPWVVQHESELRHNGLGNSLLGVKWRFFESKKWDLQISTYPQLELNNPDHSLRRGLVEKAPAFLLPIEVTKKIGPIDWNLESGYWFQEHTARRWIAGLAAGHQFGRRWELLSEVHTIGTDEGRDKTWDVGSRVTLAKPVRLLLMSGSRFTGDTRQPRFIGYFGLQFLFPVREPGHSD